MNKEKLIYRINMTPFAVFNTIILFFIAIVFFFGVMWFGGTLVGSGGISYDTYFSEYKPMIIISESMTPTIAVNSLLLVEDKPFEDLRIGDIIFFHTKQHGMVGHRIIASMGDGFKTKGDNNKLIDDWIVTEDMYKGCVYEIHNEFAPLITLLFGDLDNISLAKLFLGFVLLAIFFTAILYFFKGIYDYLFVYHFLKKSSEKGGINVVQQYYPNLKNGIKEEDIVNAFEHLNKDFSFLKRIKVRYHLLALHRSLLLEERVKQRYLYRLEDFRKELK